MRYVRDNDKSTSPGSIFGGPVDNNVFLQFVPGRVDRVLQAQIHLVVFLKMM